MEDASQLYAQRVIKLRAIMLEAINGAKSTHQRATPLDSYWQCVFLPHPEYSPAVYKHVLELLSQEEGYLIELQSEPTRYVVKGRLPSTLNTARDFHELHQLGRDFCCYSADDVAVQSIVQQILTIAALDCSIITGMAFLPRVQFYPAEIYEAAVKHLRALGFAVVLDSLVLTINFSAV